MEYSDYKWFIKHDLGVQEVFERPQTRYTATTPVMKCKNQIFTVSDLLSACSYTVNFIKANFDVSVKKYSDALFVLKTIYLLLNNHPQNQPSKETLHYFVDVLHEIADMQTYCSEEKRANAKVAIMLSAMIDLFVQN